MDKKEFRRRVLAERRAYPAEKITRFSKEIAERLFAAEEFDRAGTVLCFVSTEAEVCTRPIIEHALFLGKRLAVPRCIKGSCEMEFCYITSMEDLAEGAFGILEPKPHCEVYTAEKAENNTLCIVPGLCCDRRGQRMGYGRGYYDRFLAHFSGISCGLFFADFVFDRIPTEETDVPLDMIITEKHLFRNI